MTLQKIVIEVGGKADLKSTIDQLVKLGVIDENNAKSFLENSKKTQNAVDENSKKLGGFEKALSKIGPVLAGAFAVSQIVSFGKSVVDITAKFQKFEAVLTNTLGSRSAAQQAMKTIKEFAASTPFAVDELTDSYVKLANSGFKPTAEEMRKLGDLASSQGKSFMQLTEGLMDATTFEFERLKEFGIRAEKNGNKIKFTFKEQETVVDKTNDAVRKYILSLGDLEGVSGGMAAISKTLGGQISNLGDSFDALQVALGERFKGAISASLEVVGDLVQGLTELVEVPVSQKLEEERIALNGLVTQIISTNDNNDKRKKLIDQLNLQYPEFLKNLDKEKVTNGELVTRLKEINTQYVNRIILQRKQEEIDKFANDLADKKTALLNEEINIYRQVSDGLKRINKEDQLRGKTIEEQIKVLDNFTSSMASTNRSQETYSERLSRVRKELVELDRQENKLLALQEDRRTLAGLLGISLDEEADKTEEVVEETEKQITTIESLEQKVKDLTETRDKKTDISDVKAINSINREIDRLNELIKKLKGQDEATKKAKKEHEEYLKMLNSPQVGGIDATLKEADITKVTKEEAEKRHKIRVDEMKSFKKDVTDPLIKANQEAQKKITDDEVKEIHKRREAKQMYVDFAFEAFSMISQAAFERDRMQTEAEFAKLDATTEKELSSLEKRKEAGLITEAKFQAQKQSILNKQAQQEAALRRKQAQQEKQAALFQIGVNTAAAVLKGIAQFGPPPSPPGIAAIATALATGAIQAAIVASRPLPAFKDGVIDFKGAGTETSDSNIVRISKGESVMPADATRKYREDLQAMIDGTYNKYTMPVISKKSLTEARSESMAENMAKAILLQSQFNDSKIVNAIKDSKRGKEADSKLAGMIASKLSDRLSENNLFS